MIGYRKRNKGGEDTGVNIAPLIDMTFILLIFFMVSTTFVRDAQVDLERPGAASAEAADQRALRVTIDRRNNVFVDAMPVKPWMVQDAVRNHLASSRVQTVLAVADKGVRTEVLVGVIDQCRLAGANKVGVAVDREGE